MKAIDIFRVSLFVMAMTGIHFNTALASTVSGFKSGHTSHEVMIPGTDKDSEGTSAPDIQLNVAALAPVVPSEATFDDEVTTQDMVVDAEKLAPVLPLIADFGDEADSE
jgi:hypothetical protein